MKAVRLRPETDQELGDGVRVAHDQDRPFRRVLLPQPREEAVHLIRLGRGVVGGDRNVGGVGEGSARLDRPGRAAGVDGGDTCGLEVPREGFGASEAGSGERLEGVEVAVGRPEIGFLGVADEVDVVQRGGGRPGGAAGAERLWGDGIRTRKIIGAPF